MRMPISAVLLALLLSATLVRAGDAGEADACGIDGWGWQLGEVVFQREHAASENTRIVVAGVYLGVGKQVVVTETLVRGAAVTRSEPSSHVVEAPRKPDIPQHCVARRVEASIDPVRPVD
jgi:hypothetical protein